MIKKFNKLKSINVIMKNKFRRKKTKQIKRENKKEEKKKKIKMDE